MKATIIYPAVSRFPHNVNVLPKVFKIEIPDDCEEPLEYIFRVMNIVDGSEKELPTKLKCRSMMVGDIVILNDEVHYCDSFGWKKLS
jgi:hypothetical protein